MAIAYLALFILGAWSGAIHPACYAYIGAVLPLVSAFIYLYTCPMAPCSVRHGNLQYCFECPEYSCKHYDGFDSYDTLVLHRNQRKDMQRAKEIGIEAYRAEQQQKVELLNKLLETYDDSNKQVFYCTAVNLLSIDDMKAIIDKADRETADMELSERAAYIKKEIAQLI